MRLPVLGVSVALSACGAASGNDVKLTQVWAQPVTAGRTSAAVYMTISAGCPAEDVLQSAEAPSPQKASLHSSSEADGALMMTPVMSIPVRCGTPKVLKPMGMHIMVTGIQKPVGIGDRLPLVLHFERAGAIPVEAEITSMAVLENVDPMGMHKKHPHGRTMNMDHMDMH